MRKFSLILILVLFFACYKEGGNRLLKKSKIHGKKVITLYTVDGIDSLFYLKDSVFMCSDFALDFRKDLTDQSGAPGTEGIYNLRVECGGNLIFPCQTPCWAGGARNISFTTIPSNYSFNYCEDLEENCRQIRKQTPSPLCGLWTITKLTWKELWIEQEKNNRKYMVHFKEKK